MINRKDIIELHKKQLKLEIDAIRLSIQHSAVKGSEAEFAFKRLLRKYLPQKYKLSSGFVTNANNISHQHDIIIYDDFMNVPMYLGDNSGSFLGGATYGVLETTITQLGSAKLEEDIKKIAALRNLFRKGKVAFQKVISCPIFNENELENIIGHLLALTSPVVIFIILVTVTNWNHIYCAIVAMFLGGIVALLCRPDLKKKIWVGGLLFLGLYFIIFLSLVKIFPGYVRNVWNLSHISGILIFGIPLEELLFAFALGMLWSSLYEHIYWLRLAKDACN